MTSYEIEIEGVQRSPFLMLMPAGWPHAPTQLVRPLVTGPTLAEIPLVTPVYFIGDPGRTEFRRVNLRSDFLENRGWSRGAFEAAARANLCGRAATWQPLDLGGAQIVLCDDDYLAAERILDPTFLGLGARALGTTGPCLALVPTRGHLFLTPFASAPTQLRAFAALGRTLCADAGGDGLSPWPYLVADGRVDTIMEIA